MACRLQDIALYLLLIMKLIGFLTLFAAFFFPTENIGATPVETGQGSVEQKVAHTTVDSPRDGLRRRSYIPTVLKTNLLFDLVGAPNIGVEWLAGDKISISIDTALAFWRIDDLYTLQTAQGGLGAKYWFGSRLDMPLTGWNAGVYAMFGNRYDVQWRDGYQGRGFVSAGLSAGYSTRIGKRMNLELSMAAGYFYTPEVRHYHRPENGHLIWQQTRYRVGRVTLTKIQLNLAWMMGKRGEN